MQQNPTGRNLTLSVGTVLDIADYNNFVNQTQYGMIPVATDTGYAVAFPLSVNTINIPLVKNGLDGSCNDISNILRTMGADACALNVKDYDNCIKDYSSYCTFINPKEQSICKSISSSKKLSQYCTSVTISHECATSLIPNTICFYWDKTTKTYECTPAGLGNPSCPNSSLDGSSGILCNCSDFGSITIPSD